MSYDAVRPPGLFPGAPYDYAAIAQGPGLVITAGACPIDDAGRVTAPHDFEVQTKKALENLFVTLAASGTSPDKVLKTTVYVASSERSDLVRVWNVVASAFAPARPPSTLLGVAVLGYPDQLVEIEAVALAGPRP